METIKTDNLDALLREIKAGFDPFYEKINQLAQQAENVSEQIESAKSNYDVETLDKLENTLKNIRVVREQVVRDSDAHRKIINSRTEEHESLVSRVQEAYLEDFAIENTKVQDLFTLISDLENQLDQAKSELSEKHKQVIKKLGSTVGRFSRYTPSYSKPDVITSTMRSFKDESTGETYFSW